MAAWRQVDEKDPKSRIVGIFVFPIVAFREIPGPGKGRRGSGGARPGVDALCPTNRNAWRVQVKSHHYPFLDNGCPGDTSSAELRPLQAPH